MGGSLTPRCPQIISSRPFNTIKKFKYKKRTQDEAFFTKTQKAKRRPSQDDFESRISNYNENTTHTETGRMTQSTLSFLVPPNAASGDSATPTGALGAIPKGFLANSHPNPKMDTASKT